MARTFEGVTPGIVPRSRYSNVLPMCILNFFSPYLVLSFFLICFIYSHFFDCPLFVRELFIKFGGLCAEPYALYSLHGSVLYNGLTHKFHHWKTSSHPLWMIFRSSKTPSDRGLPPDALHLQSSETQSLPSGRYFRDVFQIDVPDDVIDGLSVANYDGSVQSFISRHDDIVSRAEAIVLACTHLKLARSHKERALGIIIFLKMMFPGKSLSNHLITHCISVWQTISADIEPQSFETFIDGLHTGVVTWDVLKTSPVFTKMHRFIMFALSAGFFDKVGLSFDSLSYTELERQAHLKEFPANSLSMVECILRTSVFILRTGHRILVHNDWSGFVHSGETYVELSKEYTWLDHRFPLFFCCATSDFTEQEYRTRLKSCLEAHETAVMHLRAMKSPEARFMGTRLSNLQRFDLDINSRANAQLPRKMPFSLLINSPPGRGKSIFTKQLWKYFAQVKSEDKQALPSGDHYCYTRNPAAEFWDGFSTEQWCIILDDIAFMNPSIAKSGGDATVMEVLQVVNSTVLVPNQAALGDKGRIPCRPELVIATTNTPHLNTKLYYNTPSAVMRRFPFRIDISVKPEFATTDGQLSHDKLSDISIYDAWDIKVFQHTVGREPNTYGCDMVLETSSLGTFQQWFALEIIKFSRKQKLVKEAETNLDQTELCSSCYAFQNLCQCDKDTPFHSAIAVEAAKLPVETPPTSVIYEELPFEEVVPDPPLVPTETGPLLSVVTPDISVGIASHTVDTDSDGSEYTNTSFGDDDIAADKEWHARHMPSPEELAADCDTDDGRPVQMQAEPMQVLMWLFVQYANQAIWYVNAFLEFLIFPIPVTLVHLWRQFYRGARLWFPWFESITQRYERIGRSVEKFLTPARSVVLLIGLLSILALLRRQSQPNMQSTEARPQSPLGEEPETHWKQENVPVSAYETSEQARTTDFSVVADRVLNNTLFAHCWTNKLRGIAMPCRMLCVGGNDWITTSHSVPEGEFKLSVRTRSNGTMNSFKEILVTPIQVVRDQERDVAMLRLPSLGQFRSLEPYLASPTLRFKGESALISRSDKNETRFIYSRVKGSSISKFVGRDTEHPVWDYMSSLNTSLGTCGCPLLAKHQNGPQLIGIHSGGVDTGQSEFTVSSKSGFTSVAHRIDTDLIRTLRMGHLTPQSADQYIVDPSIEKVTVSVGELHKKSPVRFIEDCNINVYGSLSTGRASPKSKVTRSFINKFLSKKGWHTDYTAPQMNTWKPWHIALKDLGNPVTQLNADVLHQAADGYYADIMRDLPHAELELLSKLTHKETINGAAGVTYIDAMKRNTSAGYPWRCSKRYVSLEMEGSPSEDLIDFTPEVMSKVAVMEKTYISGKRAGAIFSAHLKDEPVSAAKALSGKTRVFSGASLPYSYLVRKYLLSSVRVIQRNRFIFEAMPGVVAQSPEWTDLYEYLTEFGEDRIVAGDYKAFDKRMPSSIILYAFKILERLCAESGNYDDDDLMVLRGIATDTAFPMVDYNGDLYEFIGSNPSGHPLTVIINSIANSLYVRYCYIILHPEGKVDDFRSNVRLATYGDDNIMGVKCDWFSHTAIARVLGSVDITYTMADKEAESIPFIHIDAASFLKRTWRYTPSVSGYTCPLDWDSVVKSLMLTIPSKVETREVQIASCIYGALRESFFHGPEKFAEILSLVHELYDEFDLWFYSPVETLPTYEGCVTAFMESGRLTAPLLPTMGESEL